MKLNFYFTDKRKKSEIVAPHNHSCSEIVFYGNGSNGLTKIGDNEYSFHAGDMALISSGTVHSETHYSDSDVIFIGFENNNMLHDGIYQNVWFIKPILDTIIKEAKNQKYGYNEIISLKLHEIFIYIDRLIRTDIHGVKNLNFCKRYIEENYMHKIKLEELSAMSGYSYDYFRHLFTNTFSISPKQYIIDTRIKNAVKLLADSDTDCTSIAYMCGFSDGSQMTKLIKNKFNMTPLQIRKNRLPGVQTYF
ncbi:MAG: AraC family transcriptional regulator [Clostridia bacterium]|nr:AraC family transcriptional regulator [Clostridia bacterium]